MFSRFPAPLSQANNIGHMPRVWLRRRTVDDVMFLFDWYMKWNLNSYKWQQAWKQVWPTFPRTVPYSTTRPTSCGNDLNCVLSPTQRFCCITFPQPCALIIWQGSLEGNPSWLVLSWSGFHRKDYFHLYNNQIYVHAVIGQSAVGYCAGKPTEKSLVFWIII